MGGRSIRHFNTLRLGSAKACLEDFFKKLATAGDSRTRVYCQSTGQSTCSHAATDVCGRASTHFPSLTLRKDDPWCMAVLIASFNSSPGKWLQSPSPDFCHTSSYSLLGQACISRNGHHQEQNTRQAQDSDSAQTKGDGPSHVQCASCLRNHVKLANHSVETRDGKALYGRCCKATNSHRSLAWGLVLYQVMTCACHATRGT